MRNEKGFGIVEVLIAIALLAIISIAFFNALSTTSKALFTTDERATAESLAKSQMEYVKNQLFSASYTPEPISSEYEGYSATITDN
jgi:prepilin-type N-terminal cleavage/methylation domain-containing protein